MLYRVTFVVFFLIGYAQTNLDFDESGAVDFATSCSLSASMVLPILALTWMGTAQWAFLTS